MVLGYDELRPTKGNYVDFINKFVVGLEKLGDNNVSFITYGNFARKSYIPGESDIDALLIFPCYVVINKEYLMELSIKLTESLNGNNIRFQASPFDIAILKEGRFNSFTTDEQDYFFSRDILFGPDYYSQTKFLLSKRGDLNVLSHNLRKCRQSLLFAKHDMEKDYVKFLEKFNATLHAVVWSPGRICHMINGKSIENKFSAFEEIKFHFPDLNLDPLREIKSIYYNFNKKNLLYKEGESLSLDSKLMKVYNNSVTFFEELIREYIKKFPVEITSTQKTS